MRNDLPKAITAEDVIRRFDLSSLVKDRKNINTNKLGLVKTENILYKFIDSTLKGLNNAEDQVDGKVTTWFFDGVPTLENDPASNWTTDELKNSHIGDLYYDKTNGNTYQFIYSNEEYSWEQVPDEDINQAMALANSNPDTSDGYRDIFLVQPVAPYKVGDIWIKSNGEIYRCNVARASGSFNPAEWVISSEYSNDNYIHDARAILDSFTEFITANYVCKVLVKTTKDSIDLSVSSATTKITNNYTTAINESEGRAIIRENSVLLSAKSYTSGEIARVESEIGDIADITQTEESEYAKVSFTNVPESEPINVNIHPLSNNISYLYPCSTLYPSSNLYLKTRTIRFTNNTSYEITKDKYYTDYRKYYSYDGDDYTLLVAGTDYTIGNAITGTIYQNEYIDYELPDDLLYYDSDNYDTFELDFGEQLCKITKKCKYNADGSVSLLDEPVETSYTYPSIELDFGDYDIQLLGYSSGYVFVRLMSNNIYAGQFVTKAKLDASVNVLPHEISLETAELLSGTKCGLTIKLRDANGNVIDEKEANITMSGKVAFDDLSQSGRTTINGSNITTGTIDASVVNVTNINANNIVAGILKSSNYVANTSGTKIDLSNGLIDTKNFKVDSSGNVSITGYIHATSGEIGGCTISNNQLQIDAARITSGTINSARIPNLSADKITAGTLNVDRISAGSITANKIQDNSITNAKIANNAVNENKVSISQLSKISQNMGTITAGSINSSRAKLNLSEGYLNIFNSNGGSAIINYATRISMTAGVGISSNSNGNVAAPSNNGIDIKACSSASLYLGCMSNAAGSTEKNAILIYSGGIAMTRQPSYGSDERLKTKIKDIGDISWIDELNVKEYEYKVSPGEKNIGLIAQDYLDKEYAKYFLKTDPKGYYAIEYGNITNALIKYCQELRTRVDELERRLNNE